MGLVLDILNAEVRDKIAADDEILAEARTRRDLVAESAMEIDGALRWFRAGSLAHGTINKPVDDADCGLVLDRRSYPRLGPDGENEGPDEVLDALQGIVGPKVREKYPDAVVSKFRRGLFIDFNSPVWDEEDPTVDLIVTLTRKDKDGLWIPDRDAKSENDKWTPSHPEKHTELFTAGTRELRASRARVARLAKAWNKQRAKDDRALSSFNVVALAWECVTDSSEQLDEALAHWFRYARDELDKAETEDPAGVSDPIKLRLAKRVVVERLGAAADRLEHALEYDDDEDVVRSDLHEVYPDYVKPPANGKAALAAALRDGNAGVGASKTGIVIGGAVPLKSTRAFGDTGHA